jgi:hypothetical protein
MLHTSPRVHAQYCEAVDWEMRHGRLPTGGDEAWPAAHTAPSACCVYCEAVSTGGDEAWMGLYASCGMKLQHHASGFGSGNLGPRLYSFEIRQ